MHARSGRDSSLAMRYVDLLSVSSCCAGDHRATLCYRYQVGSSVAATISESWRSHYGYNYVGSALVDAGNACMCAVYVQCRSVVEHNDNVHVVQQRSVAGRSPLSNPLWRNPFDRATGSIRAQQSLFLASKHNRLVSNHIHNPMFTECRCSGRCESAPTESHGTTAKHARLERCNNRGC